MKKDGYVHLHALFVELRDHLEETGSVPADAYDAYEDYGVGPMAVHQRKDVHREALGHIADGVHETVVARKSNVEAPSTEQDADVVTSV